MAMDQEENGEEDEDDQDEIFLDDSQKQKLAFKGQQP
jgi:hypothetical protein